LRDLDGFMSFDCQQDLYDPYNNAIIYDVAFYFYHNKHICLF